MVIKTTWPAQPTENTSNKIKAKQILNFKISQVCINVKKFVF